MRWALRFSAETLRDKSNTTGAPFISWKSSKTTRCPGYDHYCWGYPFNWETRRGTFKSGYSSHNHSALRVRGVPAGLSDRRRIPSGCEIMQSIAEHALQDYQDIETSPDASSCALYVLDRTTPGGVINASAYRAFLLTKAAIDFSERKIPEGR